MQRLALLFPSRHTATRAHLPSVHAVVWTLLLFFHRKPAPSCAAACLQVEDFTEAVRRHYWYEFFADDLPIWGFVGPPPEQTKDDSAVYIYTHKTLDIAYNGDRVRTAGIVCSPVAPTVTCWCCRGWLSCALGTG